MNSFTTIYLSFTLTYYCTDSYISTRFSLRMRLKKLRIFVDNDELWCNSEWKFLIKSFQIITVSIER